MPTRERERERERERDFIATSVVRFAGASRTTTYVGPTQLTASIPAGDLTTAGTYNITVFNPTPGGGTSICPDPYRDRPEQPVPTTTGIAPTSKTVGDGAFTLTVNGTNFITPSVVRFNGADRTTTYVSATQLTASIPAGDLTTAGTYNITVFNPTPGGGTSNAQVLTVTAPNNPVPTTTGIAPTSKTVGDGAFTLTVNGTNFIAPSVVRFNGADRTTTYVSATQLTASIPAGDLTTAGTYNITVFNPTPGGGTSNAQILNVNAPNNPVPTTASISPTSKTVGDGDFILTVDGTNFIATSVVRFNGADRTTTYVSATQLTASIPAGDLTTAGTYNITVFNPTPGGGTSNAQILTVTALNNPVPTTTGIAPTSKTVGDGAFTLTVNGTNFITPSVVRFNGADRTTTYVSATQLTASIPAGDLTTAGTYNITVFNPTPGGGISNAQILTVTAPNNPVPTTTGIAPTIKTVGDGAFTLTVNGTNFIATSVVRFNGADRTTTYVSATQLTASIPAGDLTTAGTYNITVFNPTPGGGTSNAQVLTVTAPNNPVPTTTGIAPTSKTVGDGAFTLTVNGTNFITPSVVRFNGADRTTTYVSATQLTASIPAGDLTTAGTYNITVFNPTPGGGTSNAQILNVNAPNNPVPTTTGISPTSKTVGDGAFTLTVNGTNFIPTSVVRFAGADRTTTYVSATQLTAAIPAGDLTSAGAYNITVFNPAPGGGTSNAQPLTVNSTAWTLVGRSISASTARDGQTLTLTYQISSSVSAPVVLQTTLIGPGGETITDHYRDQTVQLVPGTQSYTREVFVNLPPNGQTGPYSVIWTVHSATGGDQSVRQDGALTVNAPVSICVPIIMYHNVAPVPQDVDWTTPDQLRAHLMALQAYGYAPITFTELMNYRAGIGTPPAKPVMLNFDDGYGNFYTQAFPVLFALNAKSTVFIITQDADDNPNAMNWTQLQELNGKRNAAGERLVDIEGHTVTHPNLTTLNAAKLQTQLVSSKQNLETHLGKEIRLISYPYGYTNLAVEQAAWQAGYAGGVIAWGGTEFTTANKWELKRVGGLTTTSVSFNPSQPDEFLFTKIADPTVVVPRITINSIHTSIRRATRCPTTPSWPGRRFGSASPPPTPARRPVAWLA